ncbi:unnamed protein product [Adineta ricciae]|uniref:Integrase catalytic domain-containing protein n=1 Tax=Adineta ricciae TaxID=249248 RepID=A0A815V963_ADIRI|nr:unnamed protein product [Adineta ricciae]
MKPQNDIPLRSAKKAVRRIRNANNRAVRNDLLSSIHVNDSIDVDDQSDIFDDQTNKIHDVLMQDQSNEQSSSDSISFEHSMNDMASVHSYSNNTDDEVQDNIAQNFVDNNVKSSEYNLKEISIALTLFRHRHSLSKSCINDLCDLLRSLGIKNVPTDFRSIERNMMFNQENILQSKKYIVCSECGTKGASTSKCENANCKSSTGFASVPTTLCTFKILPQITAILDRNDLIDESNSNHSKISDVKDGSVRRAIACQERKLDPTKKIVTLLLNSDGIVLKKFSRSIWICCVVINELPRRIRFNNDNIIICSISMGGTKPKKDHFQDFVSDWIYELHQLELGFHISPPSLNTSFVKVHAYLIAAALDKPAAALVMNLKEHSGFYSCVQCTIRGTSVPVRDGSTRVFIRNKNENIKYRNNTLYDLCMTKLSQKRMMEMWFTSRLELYSIHKNLNVVEDKLDTIQYPTTTYHLPSQLRFFKTYKGNEYRLTLLFGYQYFKSILPEQYYQHLKLLAFAMGLAESTVLDNETIETIHVLIDEFDRLFPLLYSEKSVTSVVHSMSHIPQTLRDFGPMQNYSTFNFESVVGCIVQSVNGPNLIVTELVNNINLVQRATAESNNDSFNSSLKLFVRRLFSSKRQALPKQNNMEANENFRLAKKLELPNDHIVMVHLSNLPIFNFTLYKTCWKNKVQFSIYDSNSVAKNSDSCILFKNGSNELSCGFVMAIVHDSKQKRSVTIHLVHINRWDSLTFKKKCIVNPFIFWGQLTKPPELKTIDVHDIDVKIAYNHFTKFSWLFPLKSKEASGVAFHLKNIFHASGPPKILPSDNGKEFVANVILNLKNNWPDLLIINGRARHPQSQGLVERANAVVQHMLGKWLDVNDTSDWRSGLGPVMLAINNCTPQSTKKTRDEVVFGQSLKIDHEFWLELHKTSATSDSIINEEELADSFLEKISAAAPFVQRQLKTYERALKKRKSFELNDIVGLKISDADRSNTAPIVLPYKIIEIIEKDDSANVFYRLATQDGIISELFSSLDFMDLTQTVSADLRKLNTYALPIITFIQACKVFTKG